MRFVLMLAVAAGSSTTGAYGQPSFTAHEADAQVRDAAFAPGGEVAYLAVQDRNEVWKVDPASGEVLARAAAGQRPVAVAVSADGAIVAVTARSSHDVTLLEADDLAPIATVPVGEGPVDITALPGGGFAVACSFADSVSIIDPAQPERAGTRRVEGVPSAVAASEKYLAVASRVPPAVHFFEAGGKDPRTVRLDAAPTALAALDPARFVAVTGAGLSVLDAAEGRVTAARDLDATDVAAAEGRVYALSEGRVVWLDEALEEVQRWDLAAPAHALAASTLALAAVSSQAKTWQVQPLSTITAALEPADAPAPAGNLKAEPGSPADAPEEVVEGRPLPEPIPIVPAEEVAAEPVEAAPETTEEPAVEVAAAEAPEEAPEEEEAATPAPAVLGPSPVLIESQPLQTEEQAEAAEPAAEEDDDVRPPESVFRRMRMAPTGIHAPRSSGWRPSAVPMPPDARPGFADAFSGGLGSAEGGFQAPTLDTIESLQAEESQIALGEEGRRLQELEAEGNVRLSLDNMDFAADYLYYNEVTGQLEARGNVSVEQELSNLTADELRYTMPSPEEASRISPPVEGEDLLQKRLALGEFEAVNLTIQEPAREFRAARIHYDFAKKTGEVTDFRGRAGIYYFGGQQVRVLGPASADGEDVWITTCNLDPPHYRIRIRRASFREGDVVVGRDAWLQLGKADTPVYWPRWAHNAGQDRSFNFDFDSGHSADIGYYVNVGQRFTWTPEVDLGLRLMPTAKEGVGVGVEAYYDYMETPASPLFRSEGEVRTLYTTEDRGYAEVYHRQDMFDDGVLRLQLEQWSDHEFYKDFFYDRYRDRTAPRTFANFTYLHPDFIAGGTVRKSTNGFVSELEQLPEGDFHLLERRLAENLYFTYDNATGYYEREIAGMHGLRTVNVGRLSYVAGVQDAFTITPYVEGEATWYSEGPDDEGSEFRLSNEVGATLQSRFHRNYPGVFNFSGFKHVVVPSITLSYRPKSTLDVEDTPRFDALDSVYGRGRIESKIDNIVFGRDTLTKQVWQAARVTLYLGSDLWNEFRTSEDYEIEMDLRPRPWWGWLLAAEHHGITNDYDLDQPYWYQTLMLETYERITGEPFSAETAFRYNAQYGDYDRLLTYLYYDNRDLGGGFNGRLGFAYTNTLDRTFNREILYGLGYRLGEKWGVAFEQRYDFERNELTRQEYELSRDLHCWEATVQMRERESGWDFGLELSIKALPGTAVKF